MDFNLHAAEFTTRYKSRSQLIRTVTEDWFSNEMYCPNCLSEVSQFPANSKTKDFFCSNCAHTFELKSHATNFPNTIPDGAYETLIASIQSNFAPDFFFLCYDARNWQVSDLFLVPRFFLNRSVIEKRPPLSPTARRAGWVGCNIKLDRIPFLGRIDVLKNHTEVNPKEVQKRYKKALFLDNKSLTQKGWFSDMLRCVQTYRNTFNLEQFYGDFEDELQELHPNNKHPRDKIRQQLQILRDRGFLRFSGRGSYHILSK
jgi:type II restriction enzyme